MDLEWIDFSTSYNSTIKTVFNLNPKLFNTKSAMALPIRLVSKLEMDFGMDRFFDKL